MNPPTVYDSRPDTLAHIERVQVLLALAITNLQARAREHDQSKLCEPEKSVFDACTPRLKDMAYGTPEYHAALKELGVALTHHYAHNRHHPEHFKLYRCPICLKTYKAEDVPASECYEGKPRFCPECVGGHAVFEGRLDEIVSVDGMSLFDLLEMLVDWKAATERMKDGGDIRRSLEFNTKRFNLSPQITSILANTIREFNW